MMNLCRFVLGMSSGAYLITPNSKVLIYIHCGSVYYEDNLQRKRYNTTDLDKLLIVGIPKKIMIDLAYSYDTSNESAGPNLRYCTRKNKM